MSENKESFQYTYSAKQQEEVERIRQKYLPKEEDKMEQLRRLDRQAERPGTIVSIAVGTIGMLVFGLGMCCCLLWQDTMFVFGIIIGILGMAGMGAALPIYNHVTKKERERIAPEVLRLTEELRK